MQPPIELLAAEAYTAFLAALSEYLPPHTKPWDQLQPIVQRAWIEAVNAALLKMGSA